MFENAKWITRKPWLEWRMPSYDELPPAPYLTKSFDVEKDVASAVLNIVAYGQGAYFINGKRGVFSDCEALCKQNIKNFKILKNSGKPYIIRTPLIPNITDTKENLEAIRQMIGNSECEKTAV